MLGSYRCGGAAVASAVRANCAPSLTSDIDLKLDIPVCEWSNRRPRARAASLSDQRQLVVLVEGWWRRQRPFERGGAGAPWIIGSPLLAHEGLRQAEKEHQQTDKRQIRAERGHQVPVGKCVGIIGNAARHARKPEE